MIALLLSSSRSSIAYFRSCPQPATFPTGWRPSRRPSLSREIGPILGRYDHTLRPVDGHGLAVAEQQGGVAGADHRRDLVISGDDRRMGEDPAGVVTRALMLGKTTDQAREVTGETTTSPPGTSAHPPTAPCRCHDQPTSECQPPAPVLAPSEQLSEPPQNLLVDRTSGDGSRSNGGSPGGGSEYAYGPELAMADARTAGSRHSVPRRWPCTTATESCAAG